MDAIKNSSTLVQNAGPFGDGDEDDSINKGASQNPFHTLVNTVRDFVATNRVVLTTMGVTLCIGIGVGMCSCKSLDAIIHYDDGEKTVDGEIHTAQDVRALTNDGSGDIPEETLISIPNNSVYLSKE